MSSWTDDVAAIGGHHRFRVSADGKTVIEHFKQTHVCLNADNARMKDSTALPITHITSPTPTSLHAFLSRQFQRPLYVLTTQNDIFWKVDEGAIGVLDKRDPAYDLLMKWKKELPSS